MKDLASDFLKWNPLGGGFPDSNVKIGVEFEVGGAYEDWGFVIYYKDTAIASGRTLQDAIDKARKHYKSNPPTE